MLDHQPGATARDLNRPKPKVIRGIRGRADARRVRGGAFPGSLGRLRALVPRRLLGLREAEGVAERQATRLRAELEIMHLHDKVDELQQKQMLEMLKRQNEAIRLLRAQVAQLDVETKRKR